VKGFILLLVAFYLVNEHLDFLSSSRNMNQDKYIEILDPKYSNDFWGRGCFHRKIHRIESFLLNERWNKIYLCPNYEGIIYKTTNIFI